MSDKQREAFNNLFQTRKNEAVAKDLPWPENDMFGSFKAGAEWQAAQAQGAEPDFDAWVLFDPKTKQIKMDQDSGTLAIFEEEHQARVMQRRLPGTEYKQARWYYAPQPAKPAVPDAYAVINHDGHIEYTVDVDKSSPEILETCLIWASDKCHEYINEVVGNEWNERADEWVVRPIFIGGNKT